MEFLLDANSVILFLTGSSPALYDRIEVCGDRDLATSTIVFAEVALGSVAGKPPSIAVLERLIASITLLPFDAAAARAYARLPFKRASFDRLIAAQALAAGLTLVTSNLRDFADIPDLRVEDWTV